MPETPVPKTPVPKILSATAIWVAVVIAIAVPIGAAAMSPLLEWRDPVYIAAGFAGVLAMALSLIHISEPTRPY